MKRVVCRRDLLDTEDEFARRGEGEMYEWASVDEINNIIDDVLMDANIFKSKKKGRKENELQVFSILAFANIADVLTNRGYAPVSPGGAARFLGVSRQAVSQRVIRGNGYEIRYKAPDGDYILVVLKKC